MTKIQRLLVTEKNLRVSYDVVKARVQERWGSLEKAREILLKPILEDLIKKGYKKPYISRFFHVASNTIIEWCKSYWNRDFDQTRRMFLKDVLKSLIIRGYNLLEIVKDLPGISSPKTITKFLSEFWGGYEKAQKELLKPLLEYAFAQGISDEEIFEQFQFFQGEIWYTAYTSSFQGIEVVKYFTQKFWGMSTDSARYFFYSKYIGHYED